MLRSVTEPGFNTQAVERLTGVPADTFRAWERRYQVPSPRRQPGGRRIYSAQDVELVRWLRQQTDNGVAVSRAVALLKEDPLAMRRAVPHDESGMAPPELAHAIVEAALRFDTVAVEQTLSRALVHRLHVFCLDVVRPALVDVGERWHRGEITPAVEHFVTGLIRRRLEQIAALLDAGPRRPLAAVGTAPSELHDVGALLFSLLLRQRGISVIYLGAAVPSEAALEVARRARPDLVCLAATAPQAAHALAPIGQALEALPRPAPRFAYGGAAFVREPDLVAQTPGIYLGDTIDEAVSYAERLLREPAPVPA